MYAEFGRLACRDYRVIAAEVRLANDGHRAISRGARLIYLQSAEDKRCCKPGACGAPWQVYGAAGHAIWAMMPPCCAVREVEVVGLVYEVVDTAERSRAGCRVAACQS